MDFIRPYITYSLQFRAPQYYIMNREEQQSRRRRITWNLLKRAAGYITKQKLIEEPNRIMSEKLQISGVVITEVSSEW